MIYKSREDEPGYIEGQRRANETDVEYEARLAKMRKRYIHQISEALNFDASNRPPKSKLSVNILAWFMIAIVGTIILVVLGLSNLIPAVLILSFIWTLIAAWRQERGR